MHAPGGSGLGEWLLNSAPPPTNRIATGYDFFMGSHLATGPAAQATPGQSLRAGGQGSLGTPTPVRYLTIPQVAACKGLAAVTVHKYRKKGAFPPPDAMTGTIPGWLPETIAVWQPPTPQVGRPPARLIAEPPHPHKMIADGSDSDGAAEGTRNPPR